MQIKAKPRMLCFKPFYYFQEFSFSLCPISSFIIIKWRPQPKISKGSPSSICSLIFSSLHQACWGQLPLVPTGNSSQLRIQWHQVSSLKSAIPGAFTPQKLACTTDQESQLLNIYQYTTNLTQAWFYTFFSLTDIAIWMHLGDVLSKNWNLSLKFLPFLFSTPCVFWERNYIFSNQLCTKSYITFTLSLSAHWGYAES